MIDCLRISFLSRFRRGGEGKGKKKLKKETEKKKKEEGGGRKIYSQQPTIIIKLYISSPRKGGGEGGKRERREKGRKRGHRRIATGPKIKKSKKKGKEGRRGKGGRGEGPILRVFSFEQRWLRRGEKREEGRGRKGKKKRESLVADC